MQSASAGHAQTNAGSLERYRGVRFGTWPLCISGTAACGLGRGRSGDIKPVYKLDIFFPLYRYQEKKLCDKLETALRCSESQSEKVNKTVRITSFLIYPASQGLNAFLFSEHKLNFLVWEKRGLEEWSLSTPIRICHSALISPLSVPLSAP
ncbi:uncharacterized [Tachysurus ichikawai]